MGNDTNMNVLQTGQVVMQAAFAHFQSYKECIGIEIRDDLHTVGLEWTRRMHHAHPEYDKSTAKVTLLCDIHSGFLASQFQNQIAKADVLFSYNRCFHNEQGDRGSLNGHLASCLEKNMKQGAVVITAAPLRLDRGQFERLKVPEHLKPTKHTTRHGMTALSVYVHRHK